MSYTTTNFTNLGQLKKLALRTDAIGDRVTTLENAGYQNAEQVESAINAKIASSYKAAGTLAPAAILPALLVAANEGKVYNISGAFETDANFVEGAGSSYPAGTNIVVINTAASGETAVYKFDVLAGFVDLSNYVEKASGTTGNILKLKADGTYEDSGIAASAVITDISGKADKVTGATNGHLAGVDGNGNLTDSGVAAADVQQKLTGSTSGNIRTSDANGFAQDGGVALTDVQQKLAANAFTSGNVRTTNADGFAQDGGVALSALLQGSAASDAEVDEMLAEVFGDND